MYALFPPQYTTLSFLCAPNTPHPISLPWIKRCIFLSGPVRYTMLPCKPILPGIFGTDFLFCRKLAKICRKNSSSVSVDVKCCLHGRLSTEFQQTSESVNDVRHYNVFKLSGSPTLISLFPSCSERRKLKKRSNEVRVRAHAHSANCSF